MLLTALHYASICSYVSFILAQAQFAKAYYIMLKCIRYYCLLSAVASDTDVQVACLTCYGAVVSTSPALPEVQGWLGEREGGPWLVEHCTTLLKGGGEQMNCGFGLW